MQPVLYSENGQITVPLGQQPEDKNGTTKAEICFGRAAPEALWLLFCIHLTLLAHTHWHQWSPFKPCWLQFSTKTHTIRQWGQRVEALWNILRIQNTKKWMNSLLCQTTSRMEVHDTIMAYTIPTSGRLHSCSKGGQIYPCCIWHAHPSTEKSKKSSEASKQKQSPFCFLSLSSPRHISQFNVAHFYSLHSSEKTSCSAPALFVLLV